MSVRSRVPKSRSVQGRGPVSRVPRSLTVPGINRLSTFSPTRASVAWGWDSQPLLQKYAVDTPVREYDPATGVYLGLRAEESRTYSLLDNRDLSTGNWAGASTVSTSTGLDGSNSGSTLEDDDSTSAENQYQTNTVSDDSATHSVVFYIGKDSDESRYPQLFLRIGGGSTVVRQSGFLNTKDGSFTNYETNSGSHRIVDVGGWWAVILSVQNNSTGNTSLAYRVDPAASTDQQTFEQSATGAVDYDFGNVELNTPFVTSPYEVSGSPATRAEDVIEKSITDAGNGFLIEGTYGGGTDVTVRQLDDGTTGNRIRLYVDASNKLLFQIDSGGVQQCSIDTGAIAVDGKFKVAVDYTGGSVAVSRDGNAVQTATATIPTVNMDRYARNHQETTGRFWFIESNCYVFATERTDSQLEALSA